MDSAQLNALRANDSLGRDLRRGVLRAVPFAFLVTPSLFFDIAAGVAALTLCALWIPLTLVEGYCLRRISAKEEPAVLRHAAAFGIVAGVWLLSAIAGLGLAVQVQYLHGLGQALSPGDALGRIALGADQVQFAVAVAALAGSLAALHTVIRLEERVIAEHDTRPATNTTLNTIAAQAGLLALGGGLASSGIEEALVFGCATALAAVMWQCVGGLVVWGFTSGTDGLEKQAWP